ncbi:MAG TPA: hypothetical protein VE690_22440 [Rhodopila sp.]|nr:hypothetical protein [Rhodopila sp.]
MATFSWAAPISGDWITAANWSPASVPNDPTAVVTIDNPTLAAYTVTIAPGEFWTVNSLSMNAVNNLAGSNKDPYTAAVLNIDGTLNFGTGSAGNLSGSLQTAVFMNNGTILNPGTIDAFVQGQGNVLLTGTNGLYITNWLQALSGVTTVDTKSIAEMTGNTLFDGIFEAKGTGGVVNLGGPRQNMIVNIATVEGPPAIPSGWTEMILNGATTAIGEWNGTGYVPLESTLNTIGSRGTVDVLGARNYATTNSLHIQAGGLLDLSAGTFSSGPITIDSGAAIQGNGTIASGIINNGTLRALDGLLSLGNNGLVGTGIVTFDFDQKVGTVAPAGGIMEVHGVGSGQTFIMNGDDTLVIDTPASFAGTIDPKPGDKILLGGVSAAAATLSGQTLNLTNAAGQTVYSLHLGGTLTGDTFAVTSLGGGTSTQVQVGGAAPAAADPVPDPATAAADPAGINLIPSDAKFVIFNMSSGAVNTSSGQPFAGPPGSPTTEYANITSDSLNVNSNTSSAFIITGSGNDVINASGSDGTNVLDGGTGSDTLLGGKGENTFLTTVLGQTKDTLTTAAYLHSGDTVTMLGVTPTDFNVDLSNNAGLPGYTGLQYAFSAAGQPTTKIVLSGYSTNDLLNGKLSQSFGMVGDTPYLNVKVT